MPGTFFSWATTAPLFEKKNNINTGRPVIKVPYQIEEIEKLAQAYFCDGVISAGF